MLFSVFLGDNTIAFQQLLMTFACVTVGTFACQLTETKNIFHVVTVGGEIIFVLCKVEGK